MAESRQQLEVWEKCKRRWVCEMQWAKGREGKGRASDKLRTVMEAMEVWEEAMSKGGVVVADYVGAVADGGGGARVSHVGTRRNTPGETKFRMCSEYVVW